MCVLMHNKVEGMVPMGERTTEGRIRVTERKRQGASMSDSTTADFISSDIKSTTASLFYYTDAAHE